jgi:hypothetical protein
MKCYALRQSYSLDRFEQVERSKMDTLYIGYHLYKVCPFFETDFIIAFASAKEGLPMISFIACFDHLKFLGGQENMF